MRWRPAHTNAEIVILTEFPWSLLMAWQTAYLSLYMVAHGTSPTAIGAAVGVSGLVQVVGLLGAGWLTDHGGRKAVIQGGDFLGWVLVVAAWAIWPTPWILLIGLVVQNGTAFVGPAWNSLFSEDADPARVQHYFLVIQLMTIIGGLAIPLMAGWVARDGVAGTGRTALWLAWPFILLAWLGRSLWLRESRAGRQQQARRRANTHTPWRRRLQEIRHGPNQALAVLRVLIQVPTGLFATFGPLVLVSGEAERLSPALLAYLPLFASLAGLGLWGTRRWWQRRSSKGVMTVATAALLVGLLLEALGPAHVFAWAALGWGLAVAGQSLFWTVHTPLWLQHMSDEARVDLQGWIGAAIALVTAVLGPVLGAMIAGAPRAAMMVLAVLTMAGLFVTLRLPASLQDLDGGVPAPAE